MRKAIAGLLCLAAIALPSTALAQASPSDFTSATRYDLQGRVTGTIAPDPDGAGPLHHLVTRNTYDPAGRLVRVEKGELAAWQSETVLPENWTGLTIFSQVDTTYDAMGRKIIERVSASGANYAVTQYSYDVVGRLECTAVRMNPAAFGTPPASACTLGTQGSQGPDRVAKNIYDAAGQLVQVRKAVGTSLEQAYVTYGYTFNGKQEFVVDANGNKAQLVYDGHDRQVQWQFPSNAAPSGYNPSTAATALATAGAVNSNDREEYKYDLNGNRTSLRKRDGREFTYNYDSLNRLTSKIVPDACLPGSDCTNVPPGATRDVYYSYDLRGLQTAARFDSITGADAVMTGYDGFGRVASSTTSMAGTSRTLTYQYDANGNRTRVTHPNGHDDEHYLAYTYDGLDRVEYGRIDGSAGLVLYTYNAKGQLDYRTSGNLTYYAYDDIGRLMALSETIAGGGTGGGTTSFAYNPASQIVTRARTSSAYAFTGYVSVNRTYATNGLNQYIAAGPATFDYDANGNLTADGSTTYTYDAENRLVGTSAGTGLTYDPLGRLWQVQGASTGITRFLYDGDQLTAEYDAAGNMLRRYFHGPGEDDPLVWFEGSAIGGDWSNVRLPKQDHQGSTVLWTSWNGGLLAINSYDEYGIPAATNVGRFQYTGQAWIPELGMYYYKARIYSPTLGRFLQTDPIGYQDQVNLYAYVANDPVNGVDPSGTCTGSLLSSGGDCSGVAFLSINGVDTQAAHMAAMASYDKGAQEVQAYLNGEPSANSGQVDYIFKGVSAADRRLARDIMNDKDVTDSMHSAWDATLKSGTERSFWIAQSGSDFFTGKVWTGTTHTGDLKQWNERLFLPVVANYHTHPGNYWRASNPSWADRNFNVNSNTLGFIQTRFGFIYGRDVERIR